MILRFLSATAAGIIVANSAGNNGPSASVLGSASAPWIINSGAFTHDRVIPTKFLQEMTGGTNPPADIEGRSVTDSYGPAPIVYAGDFDNGDPDPEQCLNPFPADTWTNGEIVLCDRGTIARVDKCRNIRAGGAAGCVLSNVDGGAENLEDDLHVIPAIQIDAVSGNELRAWLAEGEGHSATISPSLDWGFDPEAIASAANFTSRGPVINQDYPGITVGAPGVQVYAALADGAEFGFLSGTSMASPHSAGASALIKQVRPDWTPAEVISALATTAMFEANKEDGLTPADAFDVGGGIVQVDQAVNAGLLLDETIANFEAADPEADIPGDASSLNTAGLVTRTCVLNCSWTRTLEAVSGGTWTLTTNNPNIVVSPSIFTIAAGETQVITVAANAVDDPIGVWQQGLIELIPDNGSAEQHLTVSYLPATSQVPEEIIIDARRDLDSQLVGGFVSGDIDDLQVSFASLTPAKLSVLSLFADSVNATPFDDLTDGVAFELLTVPDDASRLIAFTDDLTTSSPDVDIYVGIDSNGNGIPEIEEALCASAAPSSTESCILTDPEAGEYWVLVQNWLGSSATEADTIELRTAVIAADNGGLSADFPSSVNEAEAFEIRLIWDLTGSAPGDTFFSTMFIGSSPENPNNVGTVPITINRVPNDVIYSADKETAAVGEVISLSIEIAPNMDLEDRRYSLFAPIPAGFSLVPGSATGDAIETPLGVNWLVDMPSMAGVESTYNISTSDDDPACAMPVANSGAYLDLEQLGIFPAPQVVGDTILFTAFAGQNLFYYGNRFTEGMQFTDDGFGLFSFDTGLVPFFNDFMPDPNVPNSVAAMYWRDLEIPEPNLTPGEVVGVTIALGGPDLSIIEYDNVRLGFFANPEDTLDFQMAISGFVDDSPGVYELVMAYDNIFLSDEQGTIGVENITGTVAAQYAFDDIQLSNGMAICYDWVEPKPTLLEFQLLVEPEAAGAEVIAELFNIVDAIGTTQVTDSLSFAIDPPDFVGEFFGPIVNGRVKAIGVPLIVQLKLFAGTEQTVEPDVNIQVVDENGDVVFNNSAVRNRRSGGSYRIDIRTQGRFTPGDYQVQALVEGVVVASEPVTLIRP